MEVAASVIIDCRKGVLAEAGGSGSKIEDERVHSKAIRKSLLTLS